MDPDPDSTPFFSDIKDAKKLFFSYFYFFYNLPTHTHSLVLQSMLRPVLRIRDVYPGSAFFPSRIPDPNCLHPGSRILIKEFKYLNPKKAKKWFLSSKKYDPGCSSRIPDPDADFLPSQSPDPGVKKPPNPGSLIRIRNTGYDLPKPTRTPDVPPIPRGSGDTATPRSQHSTLRPTSAHQDSRCSSHSPW
jgi:hypothetical protein